MASFYLVRVGRIGLPSHPWQGRVLPLNHGRKQGYYTLFALFSQEDVQYYLIYRKISCIVFQQSKALIVPENVICTRSETDITTVFGTVVLGSSPSGCT